VLLAVGPALAIGPAFASGPTIAEMQWHRRVLIVSTPGADDAQFLAQNRALSQWTGGDERDVSVVRIEGDTVSGSGETATALRNRYHFAAATFSVALIGKDGHVALRSQDALTGAQLEAVIDAMPMRRSGQR
jgi:hypothetical protein